MSPGRIAWRGLVAWAALGAISSGPAGPGGAPDPRPVAALESAPQEDRYSGQTSWSREPVPRPLRAAPSLELGERLYGWNCFPCHGAEGKGDGPNAVRQGLHPRDFTRGLFKLKTSAPGEMPFDEDLYRTIAVGIPVGGMPRNRDLDPEDRWALVAYVKSLAVYTRPDGTRLSHFTTKPAAHPWAPPRLPPVADLDPARGRVLFTDRVGCAACHGASGKGDGPASAELRDAWEQPAPVPDLARGELGLKSGSAPEDIFRVLSLGMAGTPMPSFASLPEKDRWDLAAFVRSLFRSPSPGERIFLGAGCAACHTLGRGKHIGPDLVDVRTRRDRAWMRQWLADPPGMLSRDPATRKLFEGYTVQMPSLNLTGREIESLIDYLEGLAPAPGGR